MCMKFWTAIYSHRHGEDVYQFFVESEPTEDDVIAQIEAAGVEFEPDREEYVTIFGPFETPEFA